MASKFTETPIPICGKELYFKRCSVNDLKVFDEQLQDKLKEYETFDKELENLNDEEERISKKIENTQRKIDLIEMKDSPSDSELEDAIKMLDKQDDLYDELKKAREAIKTFEEDNIDGYNKIQDDINEIMANKVEAMVDGITAKEFLENFDSLDWKIAMNLSKYYDMCIVGERESKIAKVIRDDISAHNERVESFRRR